jgi:hypothetical protein
MPLGQIIQIAIFVALLSVPIFICLAIRRRFQGIKGFILAVVISTVLMSIVVIIQWLGYDWLLEQKITPLDRNGDGLWAPDEEATWTKEDRRNIDFYFGDGGRNVFAVFVFPALSAVYSLAIATFYWLVMAFKKR